MHRTATMDTTTQMTEEFMDAQQDFVNATLMCHSKKKIMDDTAATSQDSEENQAAFLSAEESFRNANMEMHKCYLKFKQALNTFVDTFGVDPVWRGTVRMSELFSPLPTIR